MPIQLNPRMIKAGIAGITALVLAGCHNYVKREEFDAVVAELRGTDTTLRNDLNSFRSELEARLKNYDVTISQLQGRVSVDMATLFDFGKAELREQDKPALQQFAAVVAKHHPGAVVTVEGFTDPAGSVAYNKRLGQKRAEAVRAYLVQAGLKPDQIRAVSYGKAVDRQIVKGATRADGAPNRRAVLVVDYVDRAVRAS